MRVWNRSYKGDCLQFFFFFFYLTFPHFVMLSKRNFALECPRGYSNNVSIGSTVKPLLSGHFRTFQGVHFVKIAQCLLTINIQWLLCTVIKFHVVEVPKTFLARFAISIGGEPVPVYTSKHFTGLLFSKPNALFASKHFLVFFICPILLKLGMEEKDPSTKVRTKKRKMFSGIWRS